MEKKIICPYCFAEFSHTSVHFRMETYFDENELNEKKDNGSKAKGDSEELYKKKRFVYRDDKKYTKFWNNYGGTTEMAAGSDRDMQCEVYQLPVLDPNDEKDQKFLLPRKDTTESGVMKYLEVDNSGMVIAATDIFGNRTKRRVCPECHNPLPLVYGKYDVKFIAIIGVTQAGKTVYISQLLKHISKYSAYVKMSAQFTSSHESDFIEQNPVVMGKPLPGATEKGQLSQPMFYDLIQSNAAGKKITNTIVIYDIAGEDCTDTNTMADRMRFVEKANGIMLIVDPSQMALTTDSLSAEAANAEPTLVLSTIHSAFVAADAEEGEKFKKPIAICVSKSDKFANAGLQQAMQDISPVIDDVTGCNLPLFNATDYNKLEEDMEKLIDKTLATALETEYANYNYFIFSATGCGVKEVKDEFGKGFRLEGPPSPRRIAEPLLWLFHQFGYIKSDIPIRLPYMRPEYQVEEQREVSYGPFGLFKKMETVKRPLNDQERRMLRYEEAHQAVRGL